MRELGRRGARCEECSWRLGPNLASDNVLMLPRNAFGKVDEMSSCYTRQVGYKIGLCQSDAYLWNFFNCVDGMFVWTKVAMPSNGPSSFR